MEIKAIRIEWPSYETVTEILKEAKPSKSRYTLVARAASVGELRNACATFKPREVLTLFGLTTGDLSWARKVLDIPNYRQARQKQVVVRATEVNLPDMDQVIGMAMDKLQHDLDARVKWTVAKALHDAANLLYNGGDISNDPQ